MQTMNEVFDATQFAPKQMGAKHAVGNGWNFTITNTRIDETQAKDGGMFVVTFTSEGGSIDFRYNLWNKSEQAQNIAKGQLSALCHCIGIFQVDFKQAGRNIVGARLKGDVGFQAGQEPSPDKPEGGYVEVKKLYDLNGNAPGAGGAPSGQQQGQQQQGQPQGNFQQNNNQGNAANNAGQQGGGWGNGPANGGAAWSNNQPQNNGQQQQPQNNTGGGWSQNNNQGGQTSAPWKQG